MVRARDRPVVRMRRMPTRTEAPAGRAGQRASAISRARGQGCRAPASYPADARRVRSRCMAAVVTQRCTARPSRCAVGSACCVSLLYDGGTEDASMRYCLLTGLALAMLPGLTPAAVFRVSRLDDPPAAPCQRGDCSLRGAVLAANARAGADTIVLGAGEHSLTLPLSFDAPGGPLRVTEALELRGAGSAATTIRQRRMHRVFQVESSDFRLTGATVRDGRAPLPQYPEGLGGCIHASNPQGAGVAVVLDDVILANCSSGFAGGALFVRQGEATLRRSRVTLNRSERGGGIGIDGFGVRLVLRDGSRIDRNQANSGGAIHADGGDEFGGEYDAAYVVIGADSVIDANTAGRGGAIASPIAKALAVGLLEDDLAIPGAMARIRGNAAENGAGGAIHSAGTLALHRVHLSNNEAASGGAVHVQRGDPNGRCADQWVFDSHIANNRATRDGGGILLEQGELRVEASTFHANRAGGQIGRASCRERCRSRRSPYHEKKKRS